MPAPPTPPAPPVAPLPGDPSSTREDTVDAPAADGVDDALAILQALERGDLDVAEAERRLAALDRSDA